MKERSGLESRRDWFQIVQNVRMPSVFVVVGMAIGFAFSVQEDLRSAH